MSRRYRGERIASLLPPRKRNWTKGVPQIGLFIRTPDGGTIETTIDKATRSEFIAVLMCLHKISNRGRITKSTAAKIAASARDVPAKRMPPTEGKP